MPSFLPALINPLKTIAAVSSSFTQQIPRLQRFL